MIRSVSDIGGNVPIPRLLGSSAARTTKTTLQRQVSKPQQNPSHSLQGPPKYVRRKFPSDFIIERDGTESLGEVSELFVIRT